MSMNPYSFTLPVTGDDFYNRKRIIEEILSFESSFYFLNGIRKIGKSSILKQIQKILCNTSGVVPIYCSLQGPETNEKLGQKLRFEVISTFDSMKLGSGVWPMSAAPLELVFGEIANYCQSNDLIFVLLLDEAEAFHLLSPESIWQISSLIQSHNKHLKVVLAGTRKFFLIEGRSDLIDFSVLFKQRYIGHFDKTDTEKLILQLQETSGNRPIVTAEQVEHIWRYCGGHPFLIQFYCDEHLDSANGRLTMNLTNPILPNEQIFNHFQEDFDCLSECQRYALQIMANNNGVIEIADIAKNSKWSKGFVDVELKILAKLGFILIDQRECKISYQLFSNWILSSCSLGISQQTRQERKTKIVVIFSSDTERYLSELHTHCINLISRHSSISCWNVNSIDVGQNRDEQIKVEIKEAHIFIGLISASYFVVDSDEFKMHEMAIATNKPFIPIIAKPFLIEEFPEIIQLNPLPKSSSKIKPLSLWQNRDKAWEMVAKAIRKRIDKHNS